MVAVDTQVGQATGGNEPMSITLTAKAAGELKTLMSKEVEAYRLSPESVLRRMVQGGG